MNEEEIIDKEQYIDDHEKSGGYREEEDEYVPRVSTSIQFSDKIVEPDMAIVRRIKKAFPSADLDSLVEYIKLCYNSITRDYSLANLDKPKKTNSYDFVSFCHSEKAIMLLQSRPHLALAFDIIMKGEQLLSRSIGMKQQEIFQTQIYKKDVKGDEQKSGGIVPHMKSK